MTINPSLSKEEEELKYHLINKYRDLIARRYELVISDLGKTKLRISEEVATDIKDFFLENVYPEPARRRKLDAAFAELGRFTQNPSLVWGLLGSLPMAIFQFGVQLPAAIKAGLTALQAYTSALGFEDALLATALAKGYKQPLSDEQFFDCVKGIPRKSLDTFINEASVLFTVISNTELLSKTIAIMHDVISRMKAKPHMYSTEQVEAIKMGLELMERGYELLEPYTNDSKADIVAFIAENEMEFLEALHKS